MVTVTDAERRKIFSGFCNNQPCVEDAPVFLVFRADCHRVGLACQKINQNTESVLKDADTLVAGTHEAGMAVAAAVVAADEPGTVVIGDIRKNPKGVIQELKVPPFVMPAGPVRRLFFP